MISKKFLITLLTFLIFITITFAPPASAQLPFVQDLAIYSKLVRQVQQDSFNRACVRLDGRCLFKLAAKDPQLLADRIHEIQKRFSMVTTRHLAMEERPRVSIKQNGNLQDLYLAVDNRPERLFTVTNPDARANEVGIDIRAKQLQADIRLGLIKAKEERSHQYLRRAVAIGIAIGIFIWSSNYPLNRGIRKLRVTARKLAPSATSQSLPMKERLARRQKWNLVEIQYLLLQVVRTVIWIGGSLYILNLFAQTRIISFLLIAALRIPYRIILVGLVTYVLIRSSYILIAKLSAAAIATPAGKDKANQRHKLRINTTRRILRSTVTIIWAIMGILLAFWVNGVNLAPILTGAGILGLGLSLASQNLIKDAINGFIIIWDDRYAVGDIVDIGEVSGLVENINLRITQLRDAEGRLITVPNSVVEVVANRSSQWSRADLSIPVAYQTDIDCALEVVEQVATQMSQDRQWRSRIWEFPNILGVEQFSDRGILIRVWIKTEPLQQWDVAREFRRRVKIAFDRAGIPIPIPQQQILLDKAKVANSRQQN